MRCCMLTTTTHCSHTYMHTQLHFVHTALLHVQAALACIDTVLDTIPDKLDEAALMPHLAKGLADSKPDVQTLCHQILAKLCELRQALLSCMHYAIRFLRSAIAGALWAL